METNEQLTGVEKYELWCQEMMNIPGAMWYDEAMDALIKGKKLIHADGRFLYYGDCLNIHNLIEPDTLEFLKIMYRGEHRRELIKEQLERYFNPDSPYEYPNNRNVCGWLIYNRKNDKREREPKKCIETKKVKLP